jgi:hypothetical protein
VPFAAFKSTNNQSHHINPNLPILNCSSQFQICLCTQSTNCRQPTSSPIKSSHHRLLHKSSPCPAAFPSPCCWSLCHRTTITSSPSLPLPCHYSSPCFIEASCHQQPFSP